MKAAILVEQNRDLVVDDVELPERLDAGQVHVKLYYSGVCGSQLGEIDGVKGPDPYLPHLLGHEGSGTVVAIGPGVRHVSAGDRVVLHWRRGAGIDAAPAVYRWQGRPLNAGCVTTFNEEAVVSENRVTRLPDGVGLDVAVLFGCPVTTGLGVVTRDAKLLPGESVVVLGVGGVGLSVILGAALVSASPIVAIDRFDERLALAEQLGATHGVRSDGTGIVESVRAATGMGGADVVIENTGDADLIRAACELTGANGRTVLVGVPRADRPASIDTLPLHLGKSLVGSHGGDARPHEDIPRYAVLHRAGKLPLAELLTNRYPLDRINEAVADLRTGDVAGRCLIEIAANG